MPQIEEIAYRRRKRTPTERELSTPPLDERLLAQHHTTDEPALAAFLVLLKTVQHLSLIVEEWENLQRIFVSLALKTTTQSLIVHKLNSYARKNKTCQALWEYDNIILLIDQPIEVQRRNWVSLREKKTERMPLRISQTSRAQAHLIHLDRPPDQRER